MNLWSAVVPTAVNFGWICVAASVNTFVVITKYVGSPGVVYSYPVVTVTLGALLLCVLSIIISIVSIRTLSASLAFTIVWAFNGVRIMQATLSYVALAATAGMVVCSFAGVLALALPYFPGCAAKLSCGAQSIDTEDGAKYTAA